MAIWNFSKPTKISRKRNVIKYGLKVIEQNIKAVVDITDSLLYIASIENGKNYIIHKSSYKCKNKQIIYSQLLVGEYKHRLIIHRIPSYCIEHRPYLPFAVGCIVIGDIILNQANNVYYFRIKKCYIDNDDCFAQTITKRFRNNYNKELEERIIQHYSTFDYESI